MAKKVSVNPAPVNKPGNAEKIAEWKRFPTTTSYDNTWRGVSVKNQPSTSCGWNTTQCGNQRLPTIVAALRGVSRIGFEYDQAALGLIRSGAPRNGRLRPTRAPA